MDETKKFDWHKWAQTLAQVVIAAALAFLYAKTGVKVEVPPIQAQGAAQCCPCAK